MIHAGSANAAPAKWRVTQEMLERKIEKARAAKVEHSGNAKRGKRVNGFFFGGVTRPVAEEFLGTVERTGILKINKPSHPVFDARKGNFLQ